MPTPNESTLTTILVCGEKLAAAKEETRRLETKRDNAMRAAYAAGESAARVGACADLSRPRTYQILAK
jgi:hypothetical protein